ncbi:MAG: GNAT family N-acetyltransferase [Cohaesibacter sp.]|nr:GNAT family N-acetyltransferase [Cohaesibacter sp.]
MALRLAYRDDATILAALSIEVWLDSYAKEGVPLSWAEYVLSHFSPETLQKRLDDPDSFMWLIEEKAFVKGYIRITKALRDWEIDTLYIRRHHQGQGLGKQLLHHALKAAKAQKAETVCLTVNDQNQKAIDFYRQQGFVECGEDWFCLDQAQYCNLVMSHNLAGF